MTRGDVVLLNSDTEVTAGWLQGLQRCLDSDPAIATATPWTNNGEIASLPGFCEVNPVPPDLEPVAAAVRASGPPAYPELPTAVGFCMAISRRAIGRIGLFDENLFGRGYGEENDFSMRAAAAGLRNVLCDDVYVAHRGGRDPAVADDLGGDALGQGAGGAAVQGQGEAFIRDDPLAARRSAVLAALQRAGVALG